MIGKRIKKAREELGMTQQELAEKVGYKDKSSINRIEKGSTDLRQSRILLIAEELNTTVNWLMGTAEDSKFITHRREASGNKKIMARNIKILMGRDNINVKGLSEKINAPYSTVMDWTKAVTYPRIDNIEVLASFFKVEKSSLIEDWHVDLAKESPQKRFLLDKLKTASESDIEKLTLLWKLISEE